MEHYRSIIIGHISMDNNIDCTGKGAFVCGGAVLYSSACAHALGHRVAAVTKLAKKDYKRLEEFTIDKKDIYAVECENSTTMKNVYLTPDKERRNTRCLSFGDPFDISDIPQNISGEIYHFAGLIYGDFPNDMIKECAKRGKVALDVQACLRRGDRNSGEMFFEDWESKYEMLPYIHFLKTDAAEAEIMTGTSDRREAAKKLYGWGAKEVIITHNTEVLAYGGEEIYTCPIRARNLSGRTGRGDTTFAAYMNERLSSDIKTSLLRSAAAVSLKMETPGPLKAKREDIDEYIKNFYGDFIK